MPSSWSLSAPSGFGPELKACHVFLDAGDTLVVPSLDRYGRSLQDLINMVAELRERGIGFTSLHENLDTTTPGGRLVFHVFAALAEFIRELIIIGAPSGKHVASQIRCPLTTPPPAVMHSFSLDVHTDFSHVRVHFFGRPDDGRLWLRLLDAAAR